MYVEQWSHEEIVTYCNNANLLFSKVNELRSRVIRELLVRLIKTNDFSSETSGQIND